MENKTLNAAVSLMTELGVTAEQAQTFVETIVNPSLITDEASLVARFKDAGYDEQAAQALSRFLINEKAHGRL
jgi:hypothetical protein